MTHIASRGMEEVPYYFFRSSVKFQCQTGQTVGFGSNLGKITTGNPIAAIKSLIFALFLQKLLYFDSNFIDVCSQWSS